MSFYFSPLLNFLHAVLMEPATSMAQAFISLFENYRGQRPDLHWRQVFIS